MLPIVLAIPTIPLMMGNVCNTLQLSNDVKLMVLIILYILMMMTTTIRKEKGCSTMSTASFWLEARFAAWPRIPNLKNCL